MSEPILLVGAGAMAIQYARVLEAMGREFVVLGRGSESADAFHEVTGVAPTTGALDEQLGRLAVVPDEAIVAVNAMHLAEVTVAVARAGAKRILVEKPAALDAAEVQSLLDVAAATGVDLRVGYNRRYLSSVIAARQMIADDGGVLSVKFDFSEPAHRIGAMGKPQRELEAWFFANSTHVVDLAFSFVGPVDLAAGAVAGGVDWHPSGAVFAGFARSTAGALVSWHANWAGPGRWGVEVITSERRLILRPLEGLSVQDQSSFAEQVVDLDLGYDVEFKPGLYRQVLAFLTGADSEHLPDIAEHARQWPLYEAVCTGSPFSPAG